MIVNFSELPRERDENRARATLESILAACPWQSRKAQWLPTGALAAKMYVIFDAKLNRLFASTVSLD
jgi:hypothetical protein